MACPNTYSDREPTRFAAGYTLAYKRYLPNFLPSDGWSIQLTVSLPLPQGGAEMVVQMNSVPDLTDSSHAFYQDNFLANANSGDYILTEGLVNGEKKFPLYYGLLEVGPNLGGGAATGQLKSIWQQLLDAATKKLLELEMQPFDETDQERNRFRTEAREKLLERIQWYIAKVVNQRQIQRARNGFAPGNTQIAILRIG